jgi:hypothetical protein
MMNSKQVLALLVILLSSCGKGNVVLTGSARLPDYPSASGVEFFRDKIYIIGDDAPQVMVLDSNFHPVDSFALTPYPGKKIPKNIKPDLESMALVKTGVNWKFFIAGSGSFDPFRNMAWLVDPMTKTIDSIRLDTFFNRLKAYGLAELNIEGAVSTPGAFIFSNRGHLSYRHNHLVMTSHRFWEKQVQAPVTLIRMGVNTDTSQFSGVSGLAYAQKSDALVLTVSTEATASTFEDGAIGKSYLWIVRNISSKRNWKAINPDRIIDLDTVDPAFKGQKIESVTIVKETKKFMHLVLVADNDNGSSSLFRLVVEKD